MPLAAAAVKPELNEAAALDRAQLLKRLNLDTFPTDAEIDQQYGDARHGLYFRYMVEVTTA